MTIRIGITTSFEEPQHTLDCRYVQAIERAGALPIIVPVLQRTCAIENMVDLIDGLLIPGGPAITEGMIGDLPAT